MAYWTRIHLHAQLLIVAFVGSMPTFANAAVIADFDSLRHSRFMVGDPIEVGSTPATSPDFIIEESQITGVGLSRSALITPQHYITADHAFTASPLFRGSDGMVRQYSTSGFVQLSDGGIGTDLRLYTLTDPIPASHGVTALSVFSGDINTLVNHEILVTGSGNTAGRNIVDEVGIAQFNEAPTGRPTYVVQYGFDTDINGGVGGLGGDEIGLIGGDSGRSTLIDIDGTIALIGTNFGITSGISPSPDGVEYDSFSTILSPYLPEVQSLVGLQGYSVNTISVSAVPEPGSFAICGLLAGLVAFRIKRLRRRS